MDPRDLADLIEERAAIIEEGDRVSRAVAQAPAPVRVKALQWQFEQEDVQVADTSARHQYRIVHDRRATSGACMWFCDGRWIGCETEEAAKAAAQADYEARILAALGPHVNETPKSEHDANNVLTAPDAGVVAELVEAAKALRNAVCGPTGFAAAVRLHSGNAYPWPALDLADEWLLNTLAKLETRA